jgi:hypothetical protein
MQGHAHAQRANLSPQLALEGALPAEGRGHGIWRSGEGGAQAVANPAEDASALRLDRFLEQGHVPIHGHAHGRGVLLPLARAARHVGEQKGNGAAWQRRHGAPSIRREG